MTAESRPRRPPPKGAIYHLRGRRVPALPVVVTCEHGGHEVPEEYSHLFSGARRLLESHRGWDRGALEIAEALARKLGAPLIAATTTRLLVDLNRSAGHPARLGARIRDLPVAELLQIDHRHYHPYRRLVQASVARLAREATTVLHISVHSFAPVLRGERRTADIGLLYDPSRRGERAVSDAIAVELRRRRPQLRIRRNYPYRGIADSLVTALRRERAATRYLGLEIEVNQRLARSSAALAEVLCALVDAIVSVVWGYLPPLRAITGQPRTPRRERFSGHGSPLGVMNNCARRSRIE